MFHFFVDNDQVNQNKIYINGEDYNHIKNVVRLKEGDEVMISVADGNGDYVNHMCAIEGYTDSEAELLITQANVAGTELPCRITLYQGLPKSDKMELIIQKAVELGASRIVPVSMKRCVVKLDDKKADSKVKRWNAISESAAKQSKRSVIPQVCPVMNYKQAMEEASRMEVALVPYENEAGMKATRDAISSIEPGMQVAIVVGPEGGFEESEIELARNLGMKTISLGRRILRTETAGLSALAMITYEVEDR